MNNLIKPREIQSIFIYTITWFCLYFLLHISETTLEIFIGIFIGVVLKIYVENVYVKEYFMFRINY